MGEIKGSILGIVLTMAAFGLIFTVLAKAFYDGAGNVSDKMDAAITANYLPD